MTMHDEALELATGSPEEMFDLFERRGWGDGLPLVPPTKDRVDAMLGGNESTVAHSDDEVIATLPPRNGEVTRRALAVNAVLAGCHPGVLPVLVTAVRTMADPDFNLRGINATTHPVAPLILVHGAATDELGFNIVRDPVHTPK